MTNNPISDELQKFIAAHIHSVEQMEILCLLAENPSKAWSEDDVFKHIQSSHDSVASNLRSFLAKGLLVFEPATSYRFISDGKESARLALELVRTYRERRVTIVELIYRRSSDPIRNFADAFRIRKDKP